MPGEPIFVVIAALLLGVVLGAAGFWLSARRRFAARAAALEVKASQRDRRGALLRAGAEVFGEALILIDDARPSLVAGERALADCARLLGVAPRVAAVIDAIAGLDSRFARPLGQLFNEGVACAFEVTLPGGGLKVEGRSAGALAWLSLAIDPSVRDDTPSADRFRAFIDAYGEPAWIAGTDGSPVWVNRAWLAAVDAESLPEALNQGLSLDRGADSLARSAGAARSPSERVRWVTLNGARRALLIRSAPLPGGGVGVWTQDVTSAEGAAETLRRHLAAHDLTLSQIADAVAVFGKDRRLTVHNPAFARLWELEAAWLAERPSHAEILDRLQQRGRLPETADYNRFKAGELARHEQVEASADVSWRLPGERTLRVAAKPHPLGGLIMVFSDITPELRLKTQFNQLIQVQKATLDKLTDAVAVFGADARLKLRNEAFEAFWLVSPGRLNDGQSFDDIVELCVRRVHDLQFWRDLKARITDPDPRARAPAHGDLATSDQRLVAWQSRPLPDGATLVSFSDVTDARRLEGALKDLESALSDAERLKREFVGSVSYELRTPLTTILGYSELLEEADAALDARTRGYVAAVRQAALQLAGSIDDVLAIAQLDAGEIGLDLAEVDVAALLDGAIQRWAERARSAGIGLTAESEAAEGVISADGPRLAQVLDHLIDNALRHTPQGGSVTLSARRGLGEVRLQVADTGRGIPYHVQAHIFDRFSGQEAGGAGLGLALVKGLVELHGGWVALESEPGAGAAFTCHLPEIGGMG